MFETLFEALFRYRPVVFQQGEFRFDITGPALSAAALAGIVMVAAVVTYRGRQAQRTPARPRRPDDLRGVLALVAVLPVPSDARRARRGNSRTSWRCCWTIRAACRSPTGRRQARGRVRPRAVRAGREPLIKSLSDRFLVRTFRFSSTAGAPRFGRRADVRRLADQARRRR